MQSAYTFESRFEFGYGDRMTWSVHWLIMANVIVFAVQLLAHIPLGHSPYAPGAMYAPPGGLLIQFLAFDVIGFLQGFFWQPLTYIFLHAGLLHLFLNMLWLFVFGPDVERVLGTRQFMRFFLLCGALGVMGTYVSALFLGGDAVRVVGASGAVMGVLIAFAVLYPNRELFLFPIPFPVNARFIVLIVIIMNLVSATGRDNVSVATHFGGMAVGYVYMKAVPMLRNWSLRRHQRKAEKNHEKVGEAVDNIFDFDDERGRRF